MALKLICGLCIFIVLVSICFETIDGNPVPAADASPDHRRRQYIPYPVVRPYPIVIVRPHYHHPPPIIYRPIVYGR